MILGMEPNLVIWTTRYISAKVGLHCFTLMYIVHQKQKLYREVFAWDHLWPSFSFVLTFGIPSKMFLPENVIFRGPRLSLDHFGQQAPESPVSLLQNGVSTSSLPPFIVDSSAFQDYP